MRWTENIDKIFPNADVFVYVEGHVVRFEIYIYLAWYHSDSYITAYLTITMTGFPSVLIFLD